MSTAAAQLALFDAPPAATTPTATTSTGESRNGAQIIPIIIPPVAALPSPITTPLSKTDLGHRGWTPAMIAKLLGEPDEKREFKRRSYRWVAHLYRASRVATAEATQAFVEARDEAVARRERSKQVARAVAANRLTEIAGWTPRIERRPLDTLRQLAIDHYNRRLDWRVGRAIERFGDADDLPQPATLASDPWFLSRIVVNYLRHQPGTSYDAKLDGLPKLDAKAALAVRRRVFQRIAEVYPELADEVQRQLERRIGSGL